MMSIIYKTGDRIVFTRDLDNDTQSGDPQPTLAPRGTVGILVEPKDFASSDPGQGWTVDIGHTWVVAYPADFLKAQKEEGQ